MCFYGARHFNTVSDRGSLLFTLHTQAKHSKNESLDVVNSTLVQYKHSDVFSRGKNNGMIMKTALG